jgi:hypothetical protein
MPSLDAIARIYGKVADYVTRDLNSRRAPSERSTIHGFIFGYCPRSCRFKLAILAPEQTPTSFEMQVDVHELAEGSAFAIGSGSTLFRSMMKSAQGAVSPLDIFREITEGAKLPDVGGAPQIAYADRRGANIQPIISQSDTNPDQVKLTIFGFDLREIGDIEGFSVGFRATGVGAEKVQLRAALRHKAIDPDAPNISQDVKNSAAIEAALRALAAAKPKLNTPNRLINNENLTVAAILPVENDWYYVTNCANCGVNTPICEDPSQGKLGNVFVGQGVVRVSCWLCGKAVHASSDQITNTQWKYP